MNLKTVLKILLDRFRENHIDAVLAGGLSLSTMGIFRFTRDIDFLVDEADIDKVEGIMISMDYRKQDFSSEEIVSYISPLRAYGQVDFLVARRKYTKAMMRNASNESIFDGELNIKTVRPEDIIGLKLQALVNDPVNRRFIDEPDIRRLLQVHCGRLDMDIIREYFRVFDREALLDEWIDDLE